MTAKLQGGRSAAMREAETLATAVMSPHLGELAQRGLLRRYRKGTILIEEGDRGDTLYIIISGRLRAFSSAANGREITFGIYGPGEYLGEMSLDGGPRSASVETLEPSICSVVARDILDRFIDERPAFSFELLARATMFPFEFGKTTFAFTPETEGASFSIRTSTGTGSWPFTSAWRNSSRSVPFGLSLLCFETARTEPTS